MKRTIRNLTLGLAGLVLAGAVYFAKTENTEDSIIKEGATATKSVEDKVQEDNIADNKIVPEAPVYDEYKVPAGYCARYVRYAARDLFGVEYPSADAWKLRDADGIDEIKVSNDNLENLANKDRLKPGMLVGVYNPKSKYNSNEEVKKVGYSHVVLFLGKDKDGRLWFADKFGSKTRKKTIEDLKKENGLVPVEVLYKIN